MHNKFDKKTKDIPQGKGISFFIFRKMEKNEKNDEKRLDKLCRTCYNYGV